MGKDFGFQFGGGGGGGGSTTLKVGLTPIAGGNANCILFEDPFNILGESLNFTYDGVTFLVQSASNLPGNNVFELRDFTGGFYLEQVDVNGDRFWGDDLGNQILQNVSGFGSWGTTPSTTSHGFLFDKAGLTSIISAQTTSTSTYIGYFERTGVNAGLSGGLFVRNAHTVGSKVGINIDLIQSGIYNHAITMRSANATTNYAIVLSTPAFSGFNQGTPTSLVELKAQGLLSTDTAFRIWNSTSSEYLFNVNGDGSVGIGAYGNIAARLWVVAKGSYGVYSVTSGSHYAMYLASPTVNVNHAYYSSSIGALAAFKVEDPGGGTGGFKIGFAADSFGVNSGGQNVAYYAVVNPTTTGTNVGVRLQVANSSTANYAIQILSGDIQMSGGTKIGVTTGDLFGFWGATPTTRPSAVTTIQGLATALSTIGLIATSTIPYATATTGTVIDFTQPKIFGTSSSPETGNITNNLTGAQLGVTQKIYHNSGSSPTVPAGWVLVGTGTYTTSVLNIIYAEWAGGTRVEYWIVQ